MAATLPQLWPYVRRGRSLLAAARACRRATGLPGGGPPGEPDNAPVEGVVFGAPPGGLGRLPEAVAALSRATVRTSVTVRALRRTTTGWHVVTGPAPDPEVIAADAVVLAVPPAPAARLLRDEVPGAAVELGRVRTASMAVVSLAFPAAAVPAVTGSGFLVPPVEDRTVKAVTFSSAKWSSVAAAAPGLVLLRASVGRLGEEAVLQREDRELAGLAVADLTDALGITAAPVDVRVTRWGGGLPQYDVGHRDRVARIRAAVAGVAGLAVCGATYDGVGVPACIATAESAVADLLRQWRGD
jgi:oxygen-dependent protoporphyrinogen oxidase